MTAVSSSQPNKQLINFVYFVRACLQKADIEIPDWLEFIPHMTILKVRMEENPRVFRTLDTDRILDILRGINFGSQCFDGIHLCSIDDEEGGPDGFYETQCHI